jgi:hypothetical protein
MPTKFKLFKFLYFPKPGGGPRGALLDPSFVDEPDETTGVDPHSSLAVDDGFCEVIEGLLLKLGVKLHVFDDKQKSGFGEFLLELVENNSFVSFDDVGQIDNGLRATLPGVRLGSSSIVLI